MGEIKNQIEAQICSILTAVPQARYRTKKRKKLFLDPK